MNILIIRGLQQRALSEAHFVSDDIATLEARHLAAIELEREAAKRLQLARHAEERALAFNPRSSRTYYCPCCAVYSDTSVELAEVAAENGHRHFVCQNCANEFDFETQLRTQG